MECERHITSDGHVVVIGGGLAGITAAMALLRAGQRVTLLEETRRLGGKSGADLIDGRYQEHGLHLFPPWYVNTLRIAEELGIRSRFRSVNRIHQITRGQFPCLQTLNNPTSFLAAAHNALHSGLLPWTIAVPLYRGILDLAAAPTENLDSRSVADFVASRAYGSSTAAEALDTLVPKLIGARAPQLSAFVWQQVVRLWLSHRRPVFYMLDGNLQERLIAPLEVELRRLGCVISYDSRVERLNLQGEAVVSCECTQNGHGTRVSGGAFVLATPFNEAARLLECGPRRFGPVAASLTHLQGVPMGALTLHLKSRLNGIPREHVMLSGSRYALGFVDVSQTWEGLEGTALHFSIGNVEPLLNLPADKHKDAVLSEVYAYLPIERSDIDHVHLRTNTDAPLLVNAVGSWSYQPVPGILPGARNLYICGEHCRSAVRIVSVEGTIMSGLAAAAAVLARSGVRHDVRIDDPQPPSHFVITALRALMAAPGSVLTATKYLRA